MLGVIIYYLLAGRLPFTGPYDYDVAKKIKSVTYDKSDVSKDTNIFLKKVWNPSIHKRINIRVYDISV